MKKTFTNIFVNDIWEHNTKHLITDVNKFKKQINFINECIDITKPELIIDCGCGQCEFIQHTNVIKHNYLGIDIVPQQIIRNQQTYPNLNFTCDNFLDYVSKLNIGEIPQNTLFLVKEVIQHWENYDIYTLLLHLRRLKVKALFIFKRRGQFRCRKGVEDNQNRTLDNKYHEYPVNYELYPMNIFSNFIQSHTRTNHSFKQLLLYNFQ